MLDAYSTNLPLILMKKKGYTVINTAKEDILDALTKPFDYIVILDVFLPSDVIYKYPELINRLIRVGGNGKISVFSYSSTPVDQSLQQLLGISSAVRTYTLASERDSGDYWLANSSVNLPSANTRHMVHLTPHNEYGPTFRLKESYNEEKLMFSAAFLQPTNDKTFFVVQSITNNLGELTHYKAFPVDLEESAQWQEYSCLFELASTTAESEISCYIYNPDGSEMSIKNVSITLY